MNAIDLTPLYRSTVGFDRVANLLDSALRTNQGSSGYPPYNIEMTGENEYSITVAVAGFTQEELDIQVENGTLTVAGKKAKDEANKQFLYQGIATRSFERKFNLADYVRVDGADLKNGLLVINLTKEIPEAMKPRKININGTGFIEQS